MTCRSSHRQRDDRIGLIHATYLWTIEAKTFPVVASMMIDQSADEDALLLICVAAVPLLPHKVKGRPFHPMIMMTMIKMRQSLKPVELLGARRKKVNREVADQDCKQLARQARVYWFVENNNNSKKTKIMSQGTSLLDYSFSLCLLLFLFPIPTM